MSEVGDLLFAQILESPRDLYLRQIYADHLLDLGDPRGELISLQIASRDPDRVAWLIEAYGRTWIGPLASWVRFASCTFAEGFLSDVTLSDPARDLAPLVGDPIWSTVRAIHLGKVSHLRGGPRKLLRSVSELIAQPVMRSLTTVTVDGDGLMLDRDSDGALAFVPRFR